MTHIQHYRMTSIFGGYMGGLIIFESGEVAQFGNISRGDLLLATLLKLIPELKQQETNRMRKLLKDLEDGTTGNSEDNS
jgi:hypothetical protein